MHSILQKGKIIAIFVAILMLISIAAVAVLPSAKANLTNVTGQAGVIAQAPTTYPASTGYPNLGPLPAGVTPAYTYNQTAYIYVNPPVCGLNQAALIQIWCTPGMYHSFYDQGYTVNIIKPDGTTETLGPVNSYMGDDTYWWSYIPDQVGTWQFQFIAPGTYLPTGNYTDDPTLQGFEQPANNQMLLGASCWFTGGTSEWVNVTVQQNFVQSWPPAALPGAGDYWTRPVNPMNREWDVIAGNYPFSGSITYPNGATLYNSNYHYTPYVQAPTSCHVVWMKQNALSGLIGGWAGESTVFSSPGTPSIIYDGRCYQTLTKTEPETVNGVTVLEPVSVWECYDLRTGQIYWDQTGIVAPPTNIIYELGTSQPIPGAEANNGYAVSLACISATGAPAGTSRLLEYNPLTGATTLNVSIPVPSATIYGDPFVLSVQTLGSGAATSYRLINWTISGWAATTTFASKIISNITWPFSNLGTADDFDSGIAVSAIWCYPNYNLGWCTGYWFQGASMITGALLYNESGNDTTTYTLTDPGSSLIVHDGVFVQSCENGHWVGWSETTGNVLWVSQSTLTNQTGPTPDYPWGEFWAYSESLYDINDSCSAILGCSYAGIFGINLANGVILWHYYDNNTVPFESPYGCNSFFTGCVEADGMVYTYAGEHTPSEPIDRGWDTVCLNATTGALIWRIENTMVPGAVADGYLTAGNQDDGFMYVFGMGLSSTTVIAPLTAQPVGTPVLIQGTVLDQSPAQPNTPCVSDASMAQQMEYLHMQQPIGGLFNNVTMTGVPVVITATDQSGNMYTIGTATTSAYDGTFQIAWTPPAAGTYHISASYYGDDSYSASSAGTGLTSNSIFSDSNTYTYSNANTDHHNL